MAGAFEPRFVDLVRNYTTTQGTGPFTLGPAVSGFTSFSAVMATGDQFYYCAVNADKSGEREIGRGTLRSDGKVARDAISGTLTSFTSGTKTLALVAAADWFEQTSRSVGSPPLFTEIGTRRFPSPTNRIDTSGRASVGVYPAAYIRDPDQTAYTAAGQALINALPAGEQAAAQAAIAALLARIRAQDASGAWWVIDDDDTPAHAGHFGAVADGAESTVGTATTFTGTDSRDAIQALIDWRLYLKAGTASAERPIILPPGKFRITKPLRLGYGNLLRRVVLEGAGKGFSGTGGTQLLCDFDNHPGIVVTCGRNNVIRNLSLRSAGTGWVLAKLLGDQNSGSFGLGIDDRLLPNWFDPAKPNRDPALRYKPHAGIAIDPYMGAAPAAPYPAISEPAWLPAADRALYGADYGSSDTMLQRVAITGFAVGVSVQPSDYDGNGDFTALHECLISYCPIGLSIGNVNSRNVQANRTSFYDVHTWVATNKHGKQQGQIGGVWTDCSGSLAIQMLDLGSTSFVWDSEFRNLQIENIHRIGTVSAAGGTKAIRFTGCHFLFGHDFGNGKRGCPLHVLGNGAAPAGAGGNAELFRFTDCTFDYFNKVMPIMVNGLSFSGYLKSSDATASFVGNQHWARAQNTLAGGLVTPGFRREGVELVRYVGRSEDALGNTFDASTAPSNRESHRRYPVAHYTPSLSPRLSLSREAIVNAPQAYRQAKSGLGGAAPSLVGRTLTIPTNWTTTNCNARQLWKGAVIVDEPTGAVFIVTGRSGASGAYSFTAELQNGFRYDGAAAIAYEFAFNGATGDFLWVGGGVFTPEYPLFGDTWGPDLINIHRGDQVTSVFSNDPFVAAGDKLWLDEYTSPAETGIPPGREVTGVTAGSFGTAKVTFDNSLGTSVVQGRWPLWIRGVS